MDKIYVVSSESGFYDDEYYNDERIVASLGAFKNLKDAKNLCEKLFAESVIDDYKGIYDEDHRPNPKWTDVSNETNSTILKYGEDVERWGSEYWGFYIIDALSLQ